MNASELRKKTVSDLRKELGNLLRERFNLRMQQGIGQLSRPDQVRKVRKNIARAYTVLNEKMRAGDGQ